MEKSHVPFEMLPICHDAECGHYVTAQVVRKNKTPDPYLIQIGKLG
jgi:hypothetical protein